MWMCMTSNMTLEIPVSFRGEQEQYTAVHASTGGYEVDSHVYSFQLSDIIILVWACWKKFSKQTL